MDVLCFRVTDLDVGLTILIPSRPPLCSFLLQGQPHLPGQPERREGRPLHLLHPQGALHHHNQGQGVGSGINVEINIFVFF